MTRIAILGSTGSIGESALKVVRRFPGEFKVVALSAKTNTALLYRQIREFAPRVVCVQDYGAGSRLQKKLPSCVKVYCGDEAYDCGMLYSQADKVLLAISGSGALKPLLKAVECGKEVALANKEALVMAGPIIWQAASRSKARILPVDSEQSAIWQCLDGEDKERLRRIYLTASGGPLLKLKKSQLKKVCLEKVLRHPRWKMGKKITVDSATLMNKGLEVLEAMFLFDVGWQKIKTVIHPQAIVHSMVEFCDGVVMAQLSQTDMRIPIQYALSYPRRLDNSSGKWLDFYALKQLHFESPDMDKFPCLALAYEAARQLGTAPAVLNAANEVAVEEFLRGRLAFSAIPKVIERVLSRHRIMSRPALADVLEADRHARVRAKEAIARMN